MEASSSLGGTVALLKGFWHYGIIKLCLCARQVKIWISLATSLFLIPKSNGRWMKKMVWLTGCSAYVFIFSWFSTISSVKASKISYSVCESRAIIKSCRALLSIGSCPGPHVTILLKQTCSNNVTNKQTERSQTTHLSFFPQILNRWWMQFSCLQSCLTAKKEGK